MDPSTKKKSWYSYLCGTHCCCIGGSCTRVCNTRNHTWRKRHGFTFGIEIDVVGWAKRTWFRRGGPEFTWLQCRDLCRDRIWLGLASRSKLTWFWGNGASKLTIVSRTWLDISVWMLINLVSLLGMKNDFVFGWGSKWTCFFCGGSVQYWHCVCGPNMVLVYGSQLTWLVAWRSILT